MPAAFGVASLAGVRHCSEACRQPVMLLPNNVFTKVCALLSLAVNVLATGLIGCKAW